MSPAMNLTKAVIGNFSNIGSHCSIGICNIGNNATIGDRVVIQDGVTIGTHVVIESGCIIEEGARIGNHAHIQAGSIIRRNAKVSSKAQIACGSIITGETSFEE